MLLRSGAGARVARSLITRSSTAASLTTRITPTTTTAYPLPMPLKAKIGVPSAFAAAPTRACVSLSTFFLREG